LPAGDANRPDHHRVKVDLGENPEQRKASRGGPGEPSSHRSLGKAVVAVELRGEKIRREKKSSGTKKQKKSQKNVKEVRPTTFPSKASQNAARLQ